MIKNIIISYWIHIAKTIRIVSKSKFTLDLYNKLQKYLREKIIILSKI